VVETSATLLDSLLNKKKPVVYMTNGSMVVAIRSQQSAD